MSRNNPGDTIYLNFMRENILKENEIRLNWQRKREEELGGKTPRSTLFEIRKKAMKGSVPKPNPETFKGLQDVKPKSFHKRSFDEMELTRSKTFAGRPTEKIDLHFDMFPADDKTKAILYDGISREGKGRMQYLKKRWDVMPEDKYHFPILGSYEHGWKVRDIDKTNTFMPKRRYRTRILAETFYTRNGIPGLECPLIS